ncbi:hypothetical protein ACWDXT_06095 [Streptomyces sp. NPDC003236]
MPNADRTRGDDHYALGHLGLAFRNRPESTADFRAPLAGMPDVARLAGRPDGHRPVHLRGKLRPRPPRTRAQ